MKRFLLTAFILGYFVSPVLSIEQTTHPIDKEEGICRQSAKTTEDWTKCTYNATRAWNAEVDKYYSLLHKKLKDEQKTNIYENQKYWTLYKNYEIKLINGLYDEQTETKEKLIFRSNQKRDLIKNRAEALRLYYILTFSDEDKEQIEIHKEYNPDNLLMRGLRSIGF